jgi:uncharacterized protein
MKQIRLFPTVLLLAVVCLTAFPRAAYPLSVPPLKGYVNDNANILSAGSRNAITAMLKNFDLRTGNEVVVLTIPSLEGDPLEDFSIRVAEQWKIGKKKKDNGVIFLVAQKDRKVRIEVGYGLEGVLTDAQCSRIIRNVIVPHFRKGDYAGGINAGLQAILGAIGQQGPAAQGAVVPKQAKSTASGLLMMLFMFFLFFSRFGRLFLVGGMLGGMFGGRGMSRGGMGGFGGGGFGGGGGGFGGGGASGGW